MIERYAMSLAAFLLKTKCISFKIFSMIIYNNQAMYFILLKSKVLFNVKMIEIIIVIVLWKPLTSRKSLITS